MSQQASAFCSGVNPANFSLPNEIFLLQLPPSAFMVYAFFLLVEKRKMHTCHPSYNTIATATGVSKNASIKGIGILLEMGLVTMEPSSYFDQRRMKRKGDNLYTNLPIQKVVNLHIKQQLRKLEADVE